MTSQDECFGWLRGDYFCGGASDVFKQFRMFGVDGDEKFRVDFPDEVLQLGAVQMTGGVYFVVGVEVEELEPVFHSLQVNQVFFVQRLSQRAYVTGTFGGFEAGEVRQLKEVDADDEIRLIQGDVITGNGIGVVEDFTFPFLVVLSYYFCGIAGLGDKPPVFSAEIDGEVFIVEGGSITGGALKLLKEESLLQADSEPAAGGFGDLKEAGHALRVSYWEIDDNQALALRNLGGFFLHILLADGLGLVDSGAFTKQSQRF